MPVCRFYLQGYCKYGNKCNFDHPLEQPRYSNQYRQNYPQQSQQQQQQYRYSSEQKKDNQYYQAQSQQAFSTSNQQKSSQPGHDTQNFTDQEFLEFIRDELSNWVNSSAWKLSCYSYTKSAPCIPILEDISPEEVRYSLYEAKKNNTFNNTYQEYMNKLNTTVETIKQMINPNLQTRDYLLKYFHESTKDAQSEKKALKNSVQTENPFMKIVQQKQQQQAIQNQFFQNSAQPTTHISPQPSQNLFSQIIQQKSINQSSFMNSFVSSSQPMENQQQQQSNFQQQTLINSNLFKFNNQPVINQSVEPMNTSFFSQISNKSVIPTTQKESLFFGKNLNTTNIASTMMNSKNDNNDNYYTNLNELSNQDLNEFKSDHFTLGRIPYNPPPRELC